MSTTRTMPATADYIRRVESLRNPRRLTHDLVLSDSAQAQVDSAIAAVDRDGYAIIEGFLAPAQLEQVRQALEPIFDQTGIRDVSGGARAGSGYAGLQAVHVHNLFAKTTAIDELTIDPVLLFVIEGVLGRQFQMSVATAMCPDPGVSPQGLHQDDGHYPLPRPRPPLIANTLIALDDFSEANGATRIVPGSHKWTHPVEQDAPTIPAEMPAGSLLVFDGALWHAGGGNATTDQRRRSVNLNFNLSWLRQQENQYVGLPRKRWLEMPERLQRLLGFQKVNFLYGSVDYTDPLEYLKANGDALA